MNDLATIYVALLDENVDVWRPVQAEHKSRNVYLIVEQAYDRDCETWQFVPGDLVQCEWVDGKDVPILVATKRASEVS